MAYTRQVSSVQRSEVPDGATSPDEKMIPVRPAEMSVASAARSEHV